MADHASLGPSRVVLAGNLVVLALLILPMTIIVPVALTDRPYLSLPGQAPSLQHFERLFSSSDWLWSFAQSGIIGTASTLIAVAAGGAATVGCWQLSSGFSNIVRLLLLMPLIIPSIIYALGLYRFFIRLDLLDTYLGVILAHAVTGMPYVVITTSAALTGFDPALMRAARGLGASMPQALRRVLLPNIFPGIISGAILAFMHSWDEIVIVLFIASRSITTVPRRIWDGINDQLDPIIAAVAVIMIATSIMLLIAYQNIRPKSSGDPLPQPDKQ
jgi:putative spermidine/putrescine transport system permease protein